MTNLPEGPVDPHGTSGSRDSFGAERDDAPAVESPLSGKSAAMRAGLILAGGGLIGFVISSALDPSMSPFNPGRLISGGFVLLGLVAVLLSPRLVAYEEHWRGRGLMKAVGILYFGSPLLVLAVVGLLYLANFLPPMVFGLLVAAVVFAVTAAVASLAVYGRGKLQAFAIGAFIPSVMFTFSAGLFSRYGLDPRREFQQMLAIVGVTVGMMVVGGVTSVTVRWLVRGPDEVRGARPPRAGEP